MTTRMKWPRLAGQPKPGIPAKAREHITQRFDTGEKASSEFWLGDQLVGEAGWNDDGTPHFAKGLRAGCAHGHTVDYHCDGGLYAQPWSNGLPHGWAKQWSPSGRLLIICPFRHGTGVDYFCDNRGRLVEEHPLVRGRPHGVERWWNFDQ